MPDNTDDNVFDLFGESDDSEDSENDESGDGREIDPAVVAFMDQQSAEHNATQEKFADHYGFTHDCRCDADYSSGNTVEVTKCYADMTEDALEACAALYAENKLLRTMISQAMGLAMSEHLGNIEEANLAVSGMDALEVSDELELDTQ